MRDYSSWDCAENSSRKLLNFGRKPLDKILRNKKGKFKGTNRYEAWKEKTYRLRNKIVHEGKIGITEENSKEVLNAVINAKEFFQKFYRKN